jgi:NAD(P)-dependent dehydrogenase (short-subunit alcohol dehydrogenase family)
MPESYVALVSGGNRSIGLAICRGLAAAGLRVALGSRDGAAGERALVDLDSAARGRITLVALDVTKAKSAQAAVDRIQSDWGGVDVLVASAATVAS